MKKLRIIILLLSTFSNLTFAQKSHSDVIDVQEYIINLNITDITNSYISGYTDVILKPIVENTNIIPLDLLKLVVDSVKCDLCTIDGFTYNDTLLLVNLATAFNPDDEITISVYYHGNPIKDPSDWGGFYFMNGYAFNLGVGFDDTPHCYGRVWFPCNDDFEDKALLTTRITTQMTHTAVCGGELINVSENNTEQTKTWEWKIEHPIPTYLASVAVGSYKLVSHVYEGIERNIPVEFYVYPTDSTKTAQSFINIDTVLSVYEHKFGPYAWNRVGYVSVPFNSGAMEHVTNIAMGRDFIDGTLSDEDLYYHELAHMWFGDQITCSSAEDMWINEGWATFSETVFREFVKGRENALAYRRSSHETVLRYYHIQDGGFHALYPMDQSLTYSRTVYEKGASVAHAMRGYLGDNVFFQAITTFLQTNAYTSVSSYNFRDFLTSYTSVDMTDFFNDWVFAPGFVHYSIDSSTIVPSGSNFDVTVYIKQKLRGRETYANSNRVEISFMKNDFTVETQIMEFDGHIGAQTFTIAFSPMLVLCDYYERMSDATIDETKFLTTTGSKYYAYTYFKANVLSIVPEDTAMLRITHNWVAPDTFYNAVPGLYIANNRFWTIEGNFPTGFKTKGEFSYSTSASSTGYLDNNFITNSLDSIVLLYRPNRSIEWELEPMYNQKSLKRIIVDSLKSGEYALGIYDWDMYTKNRQNIVVNNASIYPNPNAGVFYLNLNEKFSGTIKIYDMNGRICWQSVKNELSDYTTINAPELVDGLYLITGTSHNGKNIFNRKFLVQK